jgi:hypothetical protein
LSQICSLAAAFVGLPVQTGQVVTNEKASYKDERLNKKLFYLNQSHFN